VTSPITWVQAVAISRNTFSSYLANFEALAEQVTVEPAAGGGYRLTSLRPGSILEMLGLRAGDVVLRMDGRPINTLEDAARAHAWLRASQEQGPGTNQASSKFVIDAVRDGTQVQLHLRLVS
jgi:S1-C subfamily serine protease